VNAAFPAIFACLVAAQWTVVGPESVLPEDPEFENVAIDHRGRVTLAPVLELEVELDEAAVWDMTAPGDAGYVGTGSRGRVYRFLPGLSPADSPVAVHDPGEGQVLAVSTCGSGGTCFGVTPGGRLYRVRGETASLLAETGEDYVFDLLPGTSGALYCATGTQGRLYRVGSGGNAEVLFTANQAHITTLAWLEPGRVLLAGTSPDGIVYRLRLRGPGLDPEVSVLLDTPLEETRAVAVANGRVYAGANPGETGENGGSPMVYCVEPDGTPCWEWSCPGSTVFDLEPGPRGLLVATGDEGMIYRLDSLGRPTVLQRVEEPQVLLLHAGAEETWVGTTEPARLYRLDEDHAREGHILSVPHDCEARAVFGAVTFQAEVPAGTELAIDTRTGDSEEPDSTWSDWAPVRGIAASPPARFIQWRARLSSRFPDRTPRLDRVDLFYAVPNRAPVITELAVGELEPGDAEAGRAKPVREITWTAEDPDGDSLAYTLHFRGRDEATWKELESDIAGASFSLDTRTLPDGSYLLRLKADDSPARPGTETRIAERTTPSFLIDNTPPTVSGIRVDGTKVSCSADDRHARIAAARVSVNAGPWQPLGPADGILDSGRETMEGTVELRSGNNTVAVWCSDSHGNVATYQTSVRR